MAEQNLRVNITGNAKGLTTAINSASSRLKSFGSKMSSVGSQLQTKLALPLTLIGGASIKMAMDFDKSMTQIKSLVGIAGDQVDKMGQQARQMAIQTGISSSEAAEALFFVTSAGLRGADAMEVLNASLKASAVGLGDTKTIADLSTSAMNAYGSETLSASEATDILIASVREGKLEASELAGAMGGVIPIASNMGVEFNEIGAAMAAMSRTGTNAANAATQLNAILVSIKKPTKQSVETLAEMGLTTEDVQRSLADDGLIATLEMLQNGLKQTGKDASSIFPNVRALKGVLDLTGAGLESNKEIFKSLNKTMGDTNNAFKETSKSASFQFQKAINGARETLSQLGSQLLIFVVPLLQKAAGFVTNLYKRFKELSPTTQKLVIAFSGLAVVLPTILTVVGSMITVFGALLSPIGLVAGGLAGIAYIIYKNWNEVLPVIVGFYNQFAALYNSSELLRGSIGLLGSTFDIVFSIAGASIKNMLTGVNTIFKLIQEFATKGIKGSFGEIIANGLAETTTNTIKTANKIGDAISQGISDGISNKLEYKTTEQVQTSLTNAVGKIKGFASGLFSDILTPTGGGGGGDEEGETSANILNPMDGASKKTEKEIEATKEKLGGYKEFLTGFITGNSEMIASSMEGLGLTMENFQDLAILMGEQVMNAFMSVGQAIEDAFGGGQSFLGAFMGSLAKQSLQIIGHNLRIALSNGVTSATQTSKSFGPAAAFVLPALIAGATSLISGTFAKFANGGIVSGPTMGLVGEYPGARSNPEVIAPLNKLQGMIGSTGTQQVNVGGQIRLDGQDLIIAIERANETANRIY